jgi:FtsZ-interacting cell division protein ZipA
MNSTIGVIITIIFVVAWVVKGLSAVMGNEDSGEKQKGRSLEEWDEIQAKRREAASRQRSGTSQVRADAVPQNPAQMTMAERIELARQRARQQAGLQNQGDQQDRARRQSRAQAEQQARQQREQAAQKQRAQREQAAQEQRVRVERERQLQQRRRQAQQQADQEAQAKRRHRTKQQRRSKPKQPVRAKTEMKRGGIITESVQRVHQGHDHGGPKLTKLATPTPPIGNSTNIGPLNRNNLRKAFIMKELLDKPVALRNTPTDLLS